MQAGVNARLRYELLYGEILYSRADEQIIVDSWRRRDNRLRPHQSPGYKPRVPEVFIPVIGARSPPQPRLVAPTALASKSVLH
jgi:hypothetical protein